MFKNYTYYIIDKVAETIVGAFNAKSDMMASRMMKNFDYDKAKLTPDDIEVYRDPMAVLVYETYDDVMNSIGKKTNLFDHHQLVLEFNEDEK